MMVFKPLETREITWGEAIGEKKREECTIRLITAILRGCIEEECEVKDTESKRVEPVGKKPNMSEGAYIALRHKNYAMDQ